MVRVRVRVRLLLPFIYPLPLRGVAGVQVGVQAGSTHLGIACLGTLCSKLDHLTPINFASNSLAAFLYLYLYSPLTVCVPTM